MLRGAHEVYGEMAWRDPDRSSLMRSSLMIVPHLLLYIPALTYTYVSPEHPRLAQRIEQGLTTMVNSGELHQLFQTYYGDLIRQVDLPSRKMLFLNEQHARTWARESQLLYPAPQPEPATPN